MSDCSNHKREVAGISDMQELANLIGDLHYETLTDFLLFLSEKLHKDGQKDLEAGRTELARYLLIAAPSIGEAHFYIQKAWRVCEPFMTTKKHYK